VALILGLKLLKPIPVPPAALAAGTGPGAALPASGTLADLSDAAPSPSTQLRSRIQAESADHPNMAAQVMRAWLAEPR